MEGRVVACARRLAGGGGGAGAGAAAIPWCGYSSQEVVLAPCTCVPLDMMPPRPGRRMYLHVWVSAYVGRRARRGKRRWGGEGGTPTTAQSHGARRSFLSGPFSNNTPVPGPARNGRKTSSAGDRHPMDRRHTACHPQPIHSTPGPASPSPSPSPPSRCRWSWVADCLPGF